MMSQALALLVFFNLLALSPHPVSTESANSQAREAAVLKARIEASPELPFKSIPLAARLPSGQIASGAISGVAANSNGTMYEIQRGDTANPILLLDSDGRLLRSFGKGDFTIPHTIRVDPSGNVWTVDAGSSNVIKYSPLGMKLLTITVDKRPANTGTFSGATDIAFSSDGRIFITDGYVNARVLEYSADGRRVKQWGRQGDGDGEFNLPHSIQIDSHKTVYVADRENGRIEKFDLNGRFLGQIPHLGRTYSIKLAHDVLWATMSPLNQPAGSPGWLVSLDPQSGKILGHIDLPEERTGHSLDITLSGEPLITSGDQVLWFRKP